MRQAEPKKQVILFLISNFRRVLDDVFFLLGNSPVSKIYMSTFWNTLFHVHRRIYPPMNMERTDYSETQAYKVQTPGNYPEESIQVILCHTTVKNDPSEHSS